MRLFKKTARAMLGDKLTDYERGAIAASGYPSGRAQSEQGRFHGQGEHPSPDAYWLPEDWRRVLGAARAHACRDDTRPALCQIVLTGEWAVATDGHRLARLRFRLHHGGIPTGELPPTEQVRLPADIGWEHFPANGRPPRLWVDAEGRAHMGSGGLRLDAAYEAGNPPEGTTKQPIYEDPMRGFPPWERVLPAGPANVQITLPPELWIEALRETPAPGVVLESPEPAAGKDDPKPSGKADHVMRVREYWLRRGSVWSEHGCEAPLPARVDQGEWGRWACDPRYLADALEALAPNPHEDWVQVEQSGTVGALPSTTVSLDPIVLRREGDIVVVMPQRL